MELKAFDSPESLLEIIPRNVAENIKFRMDFHKLLSKDDSMQKIFMEMMFVKPQLYFDLCCFTYDPRQPRGCVNRPFILREAQVEAVNELKSGIDNGENKLINKSREEGATELIIKLFALYWRLFPQESFLVGSRAAEFVDAGVEVSKGQLTGVHKCLMHKLVYAIIHWPKWMQPNFLKTYMRTENLDNGSVIYGQSCNENFGAGDRCRAVMVDEHGRMEHRIAASTIDNLFDVTKCVIYNSTHFYGIGHPYSRLLSSGKIDVIVLPWERNPEKNEGMYRSPRYDEIEIKDIEYYRKIIPEAFENIKTMEPFKLSTFTKEMLTLPEEVAEKLRSISFIADGGDKNDGGWRSPWYDEEEKRRTPRGMARDVDRNAAGSGAMFFSPATLRRIRLETIRPANYKGEIQFTLKTEGKNHIPRVINPHFKEGGRGRFRWWGKLINGRPDQNHNYIVANDISRGMGSSNSVAQVIDVNTSEQVGIWVCPNTTPDAFADQAVAICMWCGGLTRQAYLIWEENGPGGAFDQRRRRLGYTFVYTRKNERARTRKKKQTFGWHSSPDEKFDLLQELDLALARGLQTKPNDKFLILHDGRSLTELETYITFENKKIGPSGLSEDEDSGAEASHGDRVIPLGEAILAMKEQGKAAVVEEKKNISKNSFAYRSQQRKQALNQVDSKRKFLR